MSLVTTVSDELKKAMLAKEAGRVAALRMIRARFIELEKAGTGPVTDDQCIAALRSLKKQREESITAYIAGNRADLAEAERSELAVIDALLPQRATEAQVSAWVSEAVAASGAVGPKDFGKAMAALMKAHKDDVDGTLARALITRALGG